MATDTLKIELRDVARRIQGSRISPRRSFIETSMLKLRTTRHRSYEEFTGKRPDSYVIYAFCMHGPM